MKISSKVLGLALAAVTVATVLTGCSTAAQTTSYNLSQAADNFEIQRRITFYNGITGDSFLVIEGACSIVDDSNQLEVTCRIGEDKYIKDFLGLSDNVTYFAEQLVAADVSIYHYRVILRPEALIPEVDIDTGTQ